MSGDNSAKGFSCSLLTYILPSIPTAQCKPPQSAPPYQSSYYGYQQQHSYEENDEANGAEYGVSTGEGGGGGGVTVGGKLWRSSTLGTYFSLLR
jgi:hypothetical protein